MRAPSWTPATAAWRSAHSRWVPTQAPLKVVIVTMTLARSPSEARQLQRSLSDLCRGRWPVVVGDGGSLPEFVDEVAQLRQVQVLPPVPGCKRTLVNQLRSAFERAQELDADYFLYTEPDKRAFFRRGIDLLAQSATVTDDPMADLIVAARTPRAFASFPSGQQAAESIMNQICSEAFQQTGDYTYGPLLISRRLVDYIKIMPGNLGWGWRFFLMAVAHQLGLRIALCTVPSTCPRAQRTEDDPASRLYRLRQLEQNMTGLGNGWIRLLEEPVIAQLA